ncbi:CD1375 family protein [Psychrobacillus sp. NPDC096426]
MVYPYMIPVYALLVKAGSREIDKLPEQYQIPVAEYLAAQVEA